jgi:hypothetical protein
MAGMLPMGNHLSHLSRNIVYHNLELYPVLLLTKLLLFLKNSSPISKRFGDVNFIQATGVGSVAFHTESGSILKFTDVQ